MSTTAPWHEREQFWKTLRAAMFPPETFEKAPEEVERVLELVDLPPNGDVLDVPCGPGRHSLDFARHGYDVTGVDATTPYLEEARRRAADAFGDDVLAADDATGTEGHPNTAGVESPPVETDVVAEQPGNLEFVEADMREFARPESFDLAVNLYTSFGYFEDRADDERVARNVHDSLRDDGTFVMHLASKETLARDFQERTWDEFEDGYVLEEHTVTDAWSWMENEWTVVADGEVHEYDVSHRLYSASELTSLLERVGFDDVAVYGDLDGSAYDHEADALVVVANK